MPPVAFPEQIDRAEPPPPRGRPAEKLIVRGVAVALALGLVGGLVMRPNLEDQPPAKKVATRQVEMPREPDDLQILVTAVPEPVTSVPPPAETAPPAPQPVAETPAQPRVATRPYVDVAPRPAPRRASSRPSFNCRFARSQSERMVCIDPNLAAADRRLAQAYREAIDSGIPERVLRRQQDVWLSARESAARYGPQDVARVYEARISELEGMSRY
ncbi:MAG TPA: lysozyme inhibitor LprI family protein [Caulobacteraceae bacterium]|nr:lysozyme inhibitor LprI family protein [Caulobacteraceae bacterium]